MELFVIDIDLLRWTLRGIDLIIGIDPERY